MKIEKQDNPLIFSCTNIPDVFFTEYFSQSSGTDIKIYLYIQFLSKFDKDIKLNDLSKKLNIPLPEVQNSIKHWEEEGIIIKKGNNYELLDLQKIELDKLYKPKINLSPEDIKKTKENMKRAKVIESINNAYFQGVMSPSWYGDINLWYSKYNFDDEVMFSLFTYCFNKSALHRNYIQRVADGWSQNNIKTSADLDSYFQKQDSLEKLYKTISRKLGITRVLTEFEKAFIEKWAVEFGYDMAVIELALKKSTSTTNPTFAYFDKILSDWHERNLKTADDVKGFQENTKNKEKSLKELTKKDKFKKYEQREHKDLSNLYANKK